MQQSTRELKIELLQFLEEMKQRQQIQRAQRKGAIVVRNRDGSVTVIRIQFVELYGKSPSACQPFAVVRGFRPPALRLNAE
jgi:hypothetical protein